MRLLLLPAAIAAAFLLASPAPAPAQAPPAPPQRLRLVTGELPPYAFHVPPPTVAEGGEPQGLVYEVVREVARRIGHPTTVDFMPWPRAQELVLSGRPNIGILALTRSPEREDRYAWVFNVVTDDLILVGGAGVDASSLDRVRGRPTGVLLHSGAEALLREQGFTRVRPALEEWINAQRLKDRLIDAWLAPRLMVLHAYREVGGDVNTLNIGQVVRRSEIWFAASPGLPEAEIARWRRGFESVQADGTHGRILARYSRLRPAPVPESARREEIPWVN
jgi:polar amino acid transport system substrate-binding protein